MFTHSHLAASGFVENQAVGLGGMALRHLFGKSDKV
jgi:hypothetical protein